MHIPSCRHLCCDAAEGGIPNPGQCHTHGPGRRRTRGLRMSPKQGKAAHQSSKLSYFGRLGFGFALHDGDVAASALPWLGGKLC